MFPYHAPDEPVPFDRPTVQDFNDLAERYGEDPEDLFLFDDRDDLMLSPANNERFYALDRQVQIETAALNLTETTGVEAGTPWWPGIGLSDPSLIWWGQDIIDPFHNDPLSQGGPPRPEDWAIPGANVTFFDPTDPTGQTMSSTWVRYPFPQQFGGVQFDQLSDTERAQMHTDLYNAGYLSDKGLRGIKDWTREGAAAFSAALTDANIYGKSLAQILQLRTQITARRGGGGGGGGRGATFKAEIPDYDTMLYESKGLLRNQLGRDPQDWEVTLIADELQRQYGRWAEAKKTATLGGNGVYEVPDPNKLTLAFFEKKYEPELDRLQARAETSVNNQMLMTQLTRGTNARASSPTYEGPF